MTHVAFSKTLEINLMFTQDNLPKVNKPLQTEQGK